ncbi:BTAD domain-containing putative transcriptional regulator [Amycolatopsis taiwanensis]|uniref:BTAD domain-containing putative transcriptional regulator n=1 Tax=Amycolatopsis taiwanensis TaxID=342230 RepID=UPI000485308B|nr:BTAD domain-containing putative transcriptional regulator [Amycolatopsis taiwanensis]
MRFGILGETRAWHDDGTEIPLGGPARRALLTLLLVRPGQVVPSGRLAEEIDPDAAPSAHALQSQVSRLRTALGSAATIERAGAGYRIVVADDTVDACRFERLAGQGRAALRDGEADQAVALLRDALELWRGPALAEITESETAQSAAVRLEEMRLGALEDRFEAELRLGGHRAAVPELRELVGRHPLRERLAGLLIRALSAEGGQAEALAVFEATRRHLAEELGAGPSVELAALHRELLNADALPSLAAPPAQLTSFVGRDEEVTEIADLLRTARLVTLIGPGGVGKTRLSVEVAALATDEVCFAELAPSSDGAGLARALLGALGLRENALQLTDGPQAPIDRLIAALSDRALVLVLDNCEHVIETAAEVVARLLAACPRLRILATSREPLGIIGETLHQVRPLDEAAAVRLFADRATAVRRGFTAEDGLVRRICAALDDLPLAIELAAARVRTLDIDDLTARLGVGSRGSRTIAERHRTLRSVIAWSWDLLAESELRAARRFSVFAGGATARAAARVCGTDEETLESLVDKSLLEVSHGRYRMLETIRAYAAEQLDEAGERESAQQAHADQVLDLLRSADPHLRRAEQLQWLPRLVAEHENLLTALRWAVETPNVTTGLELLAAASAYLWIRGTSTSAAPYAITLLGLIGAGPPAGLGEDYAACVLLAASDRPTWQRHRATAEKVLTAAWPGDRPGRYPVVLLPWMMRNASEGDRQAAFALVSAQQNCPEPWARATAQYVAGFGALGDGDTAAAERAFDLAADGFGALGDRWGTAVALDALAGLADGRGDRARAIALIDRALALTEQLGAQEDSADLLASRADHRADTETTAARADYAQAADLARRTGSAACLAAALRGLGDIALREGDPAEAERLYTDALDRIDPHWVKSLGDRVRCLAGLGRIAEVRGDHAAARTSYQQAIGAVADLAPSVPDTLRMLGLSDDLVQAVTSR